MAATIPQIPDFGTPMVDNNGIINIQWMRFFVSLINPAAAIQDIAPTGSPFDFGAPAAGAVAVSGGTVSAIDISRGATVISTGQTSGTFPVALGDHVIVTYTVLPTIKFLPA